ncbi:9486_t:CDS:2 [Entrophospora sp. SA101]|nr:9486_t:CDS:2 [Entrophospora sp. SA101]CAJ0828882.1 4882_t:CDS:2 [Entrophospora sp. SA101]
MSSPRPKKHHNKKNEEDSHIKKHHKKKSHKRQRHSDNDSNEDIKYPKGFKYSRYHYLDISEDDYYLKSTEFRLWLREYKEKFFDEMKTEEAHRYFKKFVNYWNKVKLDRMRSSQLTNSEGTRYKWNINVNQDELDVIKNSVDRQTNVKFVTEVQMRSTNNRSNDESRSSRVIGPTMPPPTTKRSYDIDEGMDEEDKERYERSLKKKEQREFRKTHNAVLDELLPKPTEAMIEKKKVKNAYYRRETSPDVELNDDDLIGGGDDFQTR